MKSLVKICVYFLQAPYSIGEKSYSWSYEIKPGVWERDEPKKLLDDFFDVFFSIGINAFNDSNTFIHLIN